MLFRSPFPAGSPRSVLFTTLTTLGMSFYTFKLYASIKQGLKLQSLPFREVLTTTLFYPAFPMGPIDASQKFDHAALSRDPDVRRWVGVVEGDRLVSVGAHLVDRGDAAHLVSICTDPSERGRGAAAGPSPARRT